MAAVFWLSFRRLAMVWRRRVIFTRSSREASSADTGARGAAGAAAGAGADFAAAIAAETSSFMMRPSRPVPLTSDAERPASAIAFSADGALATSLEAAAGVSAAAGAAAGAAATAAPSPEITPSLAEASTVVPSGAVISASTPAAGAGTSTDTLSVSSSQSISSCATLSPTFLNHVETVASETLSPSVGTITSTEAPPEEAGASAGADFAAGVSAAAEPPSEILAKSASTPTVSPSLATISARVPAAGAGTSTVTLSVSSSQSISSAATVSPGFLNQVATVASVTDSPRVGTRTSVVMISIFLRCSALRSRAPLVGLCVRWPGRLQARPRWRVRRKPDGYSWL